MSSDEAVFFLLISHMLLVRLFLMGLPPVDMLKMNHIRWFIAPLVHCSPVLKRKIISTISFVFVLGSTCRFSVVFI